MTFRAFMSRIWRLRMPNACTHTHAHACARMRTKTGSSKPCFRSQSASVPETVLLSQKPCFCPRVHERSVSADLTRAGSRDEIGSAPYAILSALPRVFNWTIYAFGKIFSREMKDYNKFTYISDTMDTRGVCWGLG